MRILYLDTEVVWRGGQEQLFSLMNGMKARGHEIHLAAPPHAPLSERCRVQGIVLHPYSQRLEASLRAPIEIGRLQRRYRFDVLHSNTPRTILAVGLAAAMTSLRPRLFASRRVIFGLSRFGAGKYNRCLDAVVAVCRSVAEILRADGVNPGKIRVVYEGVDLEWLDSLKPPGRPRRRDEVVLGIVAALTQEKGHSDMLEAAARISSQQPFRCLIVGDGPLRAQLEGLANSLGLADRVEFLGFRSDSEALMKGLDIFCLPSHSEGFSSALLTAMGNRLPVVASAVGGNRELVDSGKTGLLVPAGDPSALAEALSGLIGSRQKRRQMGEAGRRRVEGSFTLSKKLEDTEKIYQEYTGRSNRPMI